MKNLTHHQISQTAGGTTQYKIPTKQTRFTNCDPPRGVRNTFSRASSNDTYEEIRCGTTLVRERLHAGDIEYCKPYETMMVSCLSVYPDDCVGTFTCV